MWGLPCPRHYCRGGALTYIALARFPWARAGVAYHATLKEDPDPERLDAFAEVERIGAPIIALSGAADRVSPAARTYRMAERLEELGEAPGLLEFFFRDVGPRPDVALPYDPALLVPKNLDVAAAAAALRAARDRLAALETWSEGQIEEQLRALAEELGLKTGQLFGAIRVAVTGRTVAPPLFETLAALGRERTLARLDAAAQALG